MAASATDKARKSYSYLQKTLNTTITDVAVALTPNNVTNIPTDTGVSFVVDRVDSNGTKTPTLRELMTGVVSGVTLASLVRGQQSTTAQAHLANAVIEFVNSGQMWNDLIDFLLQDHSNPNGNHKTLTDDNGNEWLERGSVASAVNQIKITNAITGGKPLVSASGDDTNIDLRGQGKGTGRFYADYLPPQTYAATSFFDHVVSGGVWTGDSYGVNLNASMTALVCVINGRYISISAVTARAFTLNVDTYIDVLDNADGTGTLVYTTAATNAASPALAANSIRIGIIQAGATITAAGAVNGGEENKVLPIASSIPYCFTDSIGNIICPRDPNRKMLGYRQILTDITGTGVADITGLNLNFKIPATRKAKVSGYIGGGSASVASNGVAMLLLDVTAGVTLSSARNATNASADVVSVNPFRIYTPSNTTINVKAQGDKGTNAATWHTNSSSTNPTFLMVELEE